MYTKICQLSLILFSKSKLLGTVSVHVQYGLISKDNCGAASPSTVGKWNAKIWINLLYFTKLIDLIKFMFRVHVGENRLLTNIKSFILWLKILICYLQIDGITRDLAVLRNSKINLRFGNKRFAIILLLQERKILCDISIPLHEWKTSFGSHIYTFKGMFLYFLPLVSRKEFLVNEH